MKKTNSKPIADHAQDQINMLTDIIESYGERIRQLERDLVRRSRKG
jgi:hypothetical protein